MLNNVNMHTHVFLETVTFDNYFLSTDLGNECNSENIHNLYVE